MEALAVRNLSVIFPECETPVLSDVSFALEQGDFAVLCGATGCGKTTLLRMLKRELTPLCTQQGTVRFCGTPIAELDAVTAASQIGFVMQHPEQQIVTDKVWHELAFGLENMQTPPDIMQRRIAEIASYFGMESWLDRDPATLSGGQKQLLNLASVMIMQPKLLLLDEPTQGLKGEYREKIFNLLQLLSKETTIILVSHYEEEWPPCMTHLLRMPKFSM